MLPYPRSKSGHKWVIRQTELVLRPFDNRPISNPVDAALRSFRAFHSLNFGGTNDNFGLVDFTRNPNTDLGQEQIPNPGPGNADLNGQNNPFGRMRPTGCTACHSPYAKDGHNRDVKNDDTQVFTFDVGAPVTSVARGLSLDSLTDISGRRWRDNWLIGSTSLSSELQRRMRAVEVQEVPGSPEVRGDGLGCIVRVGDTATIDADGRCLPQRAE